MKDFVKDLFKTPFTIDKILILFGCVAAVAVAVFLVWFNDSGFEVINSNKVEAAKFGEPASLTGENCSNSTRRPIAVMLAGDPITRPLSGLSEADIVFEMPVAPNGIVRFMALYQCTEPQEIGSIRSAREDFIPLAGAFDAIYVHWGGEREALAKLNAAILNNIDGMIYEGSVFYRKNSLPMPHNGFTNLSRVKEKADQLHYSFTNTFEGYPRTNKETPKNLSNITNVITVPYPKPYYDVEWKYDETAGLYKRWRGDELEIDKNTNSQVSSSVVIVMETESHDLNRDYISVKTKGQGRATIYQKGTSTTATWKKNVNGIDGKLYFLDEKGKEIELQIGKIWVEVIVTKV